MAVSTMRNKKPEYGLIILGNSGSGKSFICNLLIGKQRFESNFQADAVTTVTEHEKIDMGEWRLLVYNIPGLVEPNQQQIDSNKREIMRAFAECPNSIVVFVWTQSGGRVQEVDAIAFKALNDAYQFKSESLVFLVNNIPPRRPPKYEGQFLATLENLLKPVTLSVKDTLFIDTLEPDDEEKRENNKLKLIHLLREHRATEHQKRNDILLEADRIQKERELLKQKTREAERDRERFQRQIEEMTEKYNAEMRTAQQRQNEAMEAIEAYRKQTEEAQRAFREELNKKNELKKLKCGGTACPQCGQCNAKKCNAVGGGIGATLGATIGAIGFIGGPLGFLTTGLGTAIGGAVGSHQKCKC